MTEIDETARALGDDREDRNRVHVHTFNTLTMVAENHQHLVQGVTGPARHAGPSHVHRIRVRTSYFEGHWHWLDVISGPAIEIMDCGHVHVFACETSCDLGHDHFVESATGQGPELREEEMEEPDDPPMPPPTLKAKTKAGKR